LWGFRTRSTSRTPAWVGRITDEERYTLRSVRRTTKDGAKKEKSPARKEGLSVAFVEKGPDRKKKKAAEPDLQQNLRRKGGESRDSEKGGRNSPMEGFFPVSISKGAKPRKKKKD